jgi:hypothetical protein
MVRDMTRAALHRLVDELPESSVEEAAVVLAHVRADPMVAAHYTAPWDDEELTPEDVAALEAAHGEADRGDVIPFDRALAEPDPAD